MFYRTENETDQRNRGKHAVTAVTLVTGVTIVTTVTTVSRQIT